MTCSSIDAVGFLNDLLKAAEKADASDLHLLRVNGGICIQARLDGVLQPFKTVPENISNQLFGRIKYLAKMKTYQERFPQSGRIPAAASQLQSDIRVSSYPTVNGENIVMRFFKQQSIINLDKLGFTAEITEPLESFLESPSGMLLLTGPAGSGKTTTIYSCLDQILKHSNRNIVTIEDPVECDIPGVIQTEINDAISLDYHTALTHILRQDPEVIVIGEIRDEETAEIAVRTAFTGHLVIATLHAGSCKGVLDRLFDMCKDRYAVLSAVSLIMNQRLIRKICTECQGKTALIDHCQFCLGTGYHGRLPIAELLELDEDTVESIRQNGIESVTVNKTLNQNAELLVKESLTDLQELKRVLGTQK